MPIVIASEVMRRTKQMETNIARCDAVDVAHWVRPSYPAHPPRDPPRRSGIAPVRQAPFKRDRGMIGHGRGHKVEYPDRPESVAKALDDSRSPGCKIVLAGDATPHLIRLGVTAEPRPIQRTGTIPCAAPSLDSSSPDCSSPGALRRTPPWWWSCSPPRGVPLARRPMRS